VSDVFISYSRHDIDFATCSIN